MNCLLVCNITIGLVVLIGSCTCMNYCTQLHSGPSLYERICCQTENVGKTVRLRENNQAKVIHCPNNFLKSCSSLNDCNSLYRAGFTTSGNYTIFPNGSGSPVQVYCDMEGTNCDGNGGWTRVAYVNMTQSNATCPPGLTQLHYNGINHDLCVKRPKGASCSSTVYRSTNGLNYTAVCGRIRGYQYESPDAFHPINVGIDSYYVDGVSITHGMNPRTHIWTYAIGLTENWNITEISAAGCPCNVGYTGPNISATFVGNHYYCESGLPKLPYNAILYYNDPLWDGQDCSSNEAPCCTSDKLPWFTRVLNTVTSDDIELRICTNQLDDDIFLDVIELYIK